MVATSSKGKREACNYTQRFFTTLLQASNSLTKDPFAKIESGKGDLIYT